MKITKIFAYHDGPWYKASEAMQLLGHRNRIVEKLILKKTEYTKRRLFALEDVEEKPIEDTEFLSILADSFTTMSRTLTEQFLNWSRSEKKRIKSVTVINNQGIPKPGFVDILQEATGIESEEFFHFSGLNCGSTFLALQHISALRRQNPLKKQECDLIFSVEIPSTTLRLKRSVLGFSKFVYDMAVSDGAALAVVEPSTEKQGLEVIGHQNFLYPGAQDTLHSEYVGNQIDQGVSPAVAEDLGKVIKHAVDEALSKNSLIPEQIKHWILHPGAVPVVKNAIKSLGLKDETMIHGLDILRHQGNSMSSLILYVLQRYFETSSFDEGDLGILIGFAPGFEIETITCRYS